MEFELNEIKFSKVFISSLAQFVFFILAIWNIFIVFSHPESFNAPLDRDDINLTAEVQAQRAWTLFFSTLYFVFSLYIFYKVFYIEDFVFKKVIIFSIGFFAPINVIVFITLFLKNNLHIFWLERIRKKNDIKYMHSLYIFFLTLVGKNKNERKLIFNNFIAYFAFLTAFAAFMINMFLYNKNPTDPFELNNYYIFEKWSFFTQLTNTSCFFYLIFFLLFKESIIVRNKNVKILISSHILVVSTIYIFILLPGLFTIYKGKDIILFSLLGSILQHMIIPFFFTFFMCLVMKCEKEMPVNFIYCARKGILFPLWYTMYIYLLCFVCRFSPYFMLSNINPNMTLKELPNFRGNYLNALFFIPLLLYFETFFFIMWLVNIKLANQKIKKALKNNFWFDKLENINKVIK